MPTADARDQDDVDGRPARRCGRCRRRFAIADDADGMDAASLDDWWACDECHERLFPGRARTAG